MTQDGYLIQIATTFCVTQLDTKLWYGIRILVIKKNLENIKYIQHWITLTFIAPSNE